MEWREHITRLQLVMYDLTSKEILRVQKIF